MIDESCPGVTHKYPFNVIKTQSILVENVMYIYMMKDGANWLSQNVQKPYEKHLECKICRRKWEPNLSTFHIINTNKSCKL
jgi:hypothetical protein